MDDNTNPTNDVNTPAETTTAGDSSSAPQTPVTQDPTTSAAPETSSDGQAVTGDKNVPYERFKEVNESYRQTQAELRALREQQALVIQQQQQLVQQNMPQVDPTVAAAKQQLKSLMQELGPELGYVSKQEIERQQAYQQVEQTHQSLEAKYSGKDGLPKYNKEKVTDYAIKMGMTNAAGLEAAYKIMNEAEITNARLQAALAQSRGIQTEASNGTGSANTGVADSDLKKAAQEGNQDAVHLLLKRRLAGK